MLLAVKSGVLKGRGQPQQVPLRKAALPRFVLVDNSLFTKAMLRSRCATSALLLSFCCNDPDYFFIPEGELAMGFHILNGKFVNFQLVRA